MDNPPTTTGEAVIEYTGLTTAELEDLCKPRELRFVQEFVLCGQGKQAMRTVDPKLARPEVAAMTMKRKPWIRALIDRYNDEAAEAVGITRGSQLMDLQRAKAMAAQSKDPSGIVAAIREQNKMLGWHPAPTDREGNLAQPQVTNVQVNILQRKQ
jgi:hypothetical protein